MKLGDEDDEAYRSRIIKLYQDCNGDPDLIRRGATEQWRQYCIKNKLWLTVWDNKQPKLEYTSLLIDGGVILSHGIARLVEFVPFPLWEILEKYGPAP